MTETLLHSQQGTDLLAAVATVEQILEEPLPEEVTEHEAVLSARARVAEENEAARQNLIALMGMPTR